MSFFVKTAARLGAAATLLALAAAASAQTAGSLSGFVYIDRNNDGQLAFSNSANPELVIGGATVDLFQVTGSNSTLVTSVLTSSIGQYTFSNLAAGTYLIRQTQPTGYVDGLDTLGHLNSNTGGAAPSGSVVGTVGADEFTGIILTATTVGNMYNFGERGLAPGFVSKRYLLGTAPAPAPVDPGDSEVGIEANEVVPEPAALAILMLAIGGAAILRSASRRKLVVAPVRESVAAKR